MQAISSWSGDKSTTTTRNKREKLPGQCQHGPQQKSLVLFAVLSFLVS